MKVFNDLNTGRLLAITCSLLLLPGDWSLRAQDPQAAPPDQKLSPAALDSLVAPIALYPDPLLSQVLVASTYPLQIVQADRWLQENSQLKGTALTDAAKNQDWDPSIQAMVAFPDVLKRMDESLKWTTDLGNAFLAQEQDVMDAVQRMRRQAQEKGALTTNEQQKVTTKTEGDTKYIVVEPASPQIIYVPTYNPVVIYGPPPVAYPYPVYPYPPPSTGAIIAASMISFGVGVALGAMWHGCCGYSGWGWGCGWGHHTTVVINNNFISHYNYRNVNINNNVNINRNGYSTWQHNPAYRGGVPYANQNVARQYNGRQAAAMPQTRPTTTNRPGGAPGVQDLSANRPASRPAATPQPAQRERAQTGPPAFSGSASGSNARMASDRGATSRANAGMAKPTGNARPAQQPRPQKSAPAGKGRGKSQ